ncbi:MAG: glycosyltransferase family 4 protein [Planctomycetota bacterium]|jgi:glycosyltransferase involved in cell wall biosynthesis
MRIGYLIPEFPGQTHIWMWRERTHLVESGIDVRMVSTRSPSSRDRARHAFAEEAARSTYYLWPMPVTEVLGAVVSLLTRRLAALTSIIGLALRLRRAGGPGLRSTLPLLPPAFRLASWARRERIDHLHVATPSRSLTIALFARRLTPMSIDVVVNANFGWWGGGLTEKFEEADAVLVITEWMLEEVRREYPPSIASKTSLARVGVDTQAWAERAAPPPGPPFSIVTVGRLHPSKGHDDVLRATARLRQRDMDVRLALLGDGPQRAELEALAAELGIGDHVTFAGSVSEDVVHRELCSAHVFVGASHAEPLGVVYMEAMALGVPTIGTDAGGVPEIIQHDTSGILVRPKDPEQLADEIAAALGDPERLARLGKAGRQRIVERFDSRVGAAAVLEAVRRAAVSRRP